jgi:glycosyltransferase involved in cell wall biosynthesis
MTEPNRPTVLVLASTYPRWQGDHEPGFVHELAKRLTDRFHVIALVPHAPKAMTVETLDGVEVIRYRYAPNRLETLVNDGGVVTNLRRHRWKMLLVPSFMLALAWCAWRLIRQRKVDVIHAHWLLPQGMIAAVLGRLSRRPIPFLVTSHGADLFALRGRALNALKRHVVRRAASVTVVSQAMRDELARIGADISKVCVQPMGVDLRGRFTRDPSVTRSPHKLLFVGRLVEKKGLRHLLDALPAILAAAPQVTLAIAGYGPEEPALRDQVESMGLVHKVDFLGAIPQDALPDLLRRSSALVAPFVEAGNGDREGLGLVMVEALGCGCPVVTTRIPAVMDVFDGAWPPFCAVPGSPESISREVLRLLGDHQAAWAAADAMSQAIRARFDWREVAAGYAQVLAHTGGARRREG